VTAWALILLGTSTAHVFAVRVLLCDFILGRRGVLFWVLAFPQSLSVRAIEQGLSVPSGLNFMLGWVNCLLYAFLYAIGLFWLVRRLQRRSEVGHKPDAKPQTEAAAAQGRRKP